MKLYREVKSCRICVNLELDVILEMKDNKRLVGKVKGVNNDGDLLLQNTDKSILNIKSGLVNKLIVN